MANVRVALDVLSRRTTIRPAVIAIPLDITSDAEILLLSALINLGYHRPLVEKAVDASLKRRTGANFEQHLRDLLRELA